MANTTINAIDNDALIPTTNGLVRLGDIKRGDFVFNREGKPVEVLKVYPREKQDAYEVTLEDGRKVICGENHQWFFFSSTRDGGSALRLSERTIKKIMDSPRKPGYHIPTCKPPEFSHKDFKIPPYVMGVVAGKARSLNTDFYFTSHSNVIPNKIAELLCDVVDKPKEIRNKMWAFPRKGSSEKLLQTEYFIGEDNSLRALNGMKGFPNEYLFGDPQQRLELLQGLLDANGKMDVQGRVIFVAKEPALVEQVRRLCWSLGLETSAITADVPASPRVMTDYFLHIGCERTEKYKLFNLSIAREKALKLAPSKVTRYFDRLKIINITKLPEQKEMSSLLIDDEDHLFLANDYIVMVD